jgi:hypothetical protein
MPSFLTLQRGHKGDTPSVDHSTQSGAAQMARMRLSAVPKAHLLMRIISADEKNRCGNQPRCPGLLNSPLDAAWR